MQPVLNISTFIYIATIILSLVAGLVLLVHSRSSKVNNKWLAAYYISTAYGFLIVFLLYSKLIIRFPWYYTYRTGYIVGLLLMPLCYFYIRSLIEQKKFRPIDLIHFIPVTIFIIDFIPYYLRPAADKIQAVTADAQQLNTIWGQFSQGWLGIGKIYVPLRIILSTIYWILQVSMILHPKKLKAGDDLLAENRTVLIWAKIFCAWELMYFLPYYLNALFGNTHLWFFSEHTTVAIGIIMTILILILRPDILYGLKGIVIRPGKMEAIDAETIETVQPVVPSGFSDAGETVSAISPGQIAEVSEQVYLSDRKLAALGEQVAEYLANSRPYLKKGCTCAALAAELRIQPYVLSAVINQVFGTNFNDFLNGYRVTMAKTLIRNGEARRQTLEALSEQCGFNNRNSFTLAFKKHTGQTPSFFIKQAQASTI